jgi:hypothetical protein
MNSVATTRSFQPVIYEPSLERIEEGEPEVAVELATTLESISRVTAHDYGHAVRSVHAKGQGLLKGVLDVHCGLSPELSQGLFAAADAYPAIVRLSTSPGDVLDDHVSTPRGMAIKVIGVRGERTDPTDNASTQDFLLVDGPAFLAPDARHFLKSLKLLASTTDKAAGLKRAVSAVFRGTERLLEATGGGSGALKSLGGHPLTQILGETFYTQTPLLYGRYIAKLSVVPRSPNLRALTQRMVDLKGRPDGLREEVANFFSTNDGEWDVQVQLCTSIEDMPIEDSSVAWSEELSPYMSVATLRIPRQNAWEGEATVKAEDALAFDPWHCIAAHRPLGSINRVRRVAYAASSMFRSAFNGCPIREPGNR